MVFIGSTGWNLEKHEGFVRACQMTLSVNAKQQIKEVSFKKQRSKFC